MRVLRLEFWTSFTMNGELRELKEPDAPATGRQLSRLNRSGMLVVVEPGEAPVLSKGSAAYCVSVATDAEPTGQRSSRWRVV
jgi:hypothetical protein